MIKIKSATSNTRGFLKNLFDYPSNIIEFKYDQENLYEVSGKLRKFLAQVVKWPIFDFFGVFQCIKAYDQEADVFFSYNRFLKTDKPYVILLENPSALVNYCWERPKHIITKYKLKKCFNDFNLKAIVCMSKACYMYINNLYTIPSRVKIVQNYPFVPDDFSYIFDNAIEKANKSIMECLYISSDFELKGGRDIIKVFSKIQNEKLPIHVTIISRKSTMREEDIKKIEEMETVSFVEFNLNKSELDEYYKKSAILLNPTRGDSFSLVTLEAMKYGCTILATDIYAIKEMDIDGYNGFITKSMFKVWDEDGTINKYYRKHQKQLVWSGIVDEKLVKWMYEKLNKLCTDRDLLVEMCCNSLKLARETEFSSEKVIENWEKIFKEALK